ncbi:MAG TPA: hypothetical protein VLA16_16985, partial [Ideonella sp.]|nr:hypothetical protein [Ideonella sp.]
MKSPRAFPLELRVLHGDQAGARAELAHGGVCRVAGVAATGMPSALAEPPDIVLRSAAGFALHVSLPDTAGDAVVTVLDGTAHLGEVELPAGEPRRWRLREPLRLGELVLA